MIMKDMIISITGVQQGPSGPHAMELVTHGQYGVEREKIVLHYDETELTGLEGTRTSFTVRPRLVELQREGEVTAQMTFEEGEKHYFLYETPFGATTMGVNTNRIRCNMGEHGGQMEIDYSVDVDHTIIGRNRFFISVKEPEESHIGDVTWPT